MKIWRLSAGEILKIFLFDAAGNQLPAGEIYLGKKLLGGQGTRWYTVQPSDIMPSKVQAVDINNAFRAQQTIRIHAGEELVLAVNDGGTAWDPTQVANQVQIPYEVADWSHTSSKRCKSKTLGLNMKLTAGTIVGGLALYWLWANREEFLGAGNGAQSLDGSPTMATSTQQNKKQYFSKWFEGTPSMSLERIPNDIRRILRN